MKDNSLAAALTVVRLNRALERIVRILKEEGLMVAASAIEAADLSSREGVADLDCQVRGMQIELFARSRLNAPADSSCHRSNRALLIVGRGLNWGFGVEWAPFNPERVSSMALTIAELLDETELETRQQQEDVQRLTSQNSNQDSSGAM